jgi:mRNA interferase RelE/StbE
MNCYTVFVTPDAWTEIKDLPGHLRQRVRRAVKSLAEEPRPRSSKRLITAEVKREFRRLRLDKWRIVYAIIEDDQAVDVLAVRKRPPYDYSDLTTFLQTIG